MQDFVTLEIKDRVAHVTLNRPDKRNSFNEKTIASLTKIFRSVELDPVVRVVLIKSTGPSFCAGADLEWMKKTKDYSEEENLDDARALSQMLHRLNELPKPVVAMVQGPAFGGGVGLVACCDIVVASETAKLCLSEVKLGLSPATISPYVISAIGASQARRYFLTAEVFDAHKAKELNLVHEVCKPENLTQEVDKILNHLLANGPEALAITKSLVYLSSPPTNPKILDSTARQIAAQRVGAEGQEGLQAFFEKRSANWVSSVHAK